MAKVLTGRAAVDYVLTRLRDAGVYDGNIDGALGAKGQAGLDLLIAQASAGHEDAALPDQVPINGLDPALCWGARVSRVFRDRVRWTAAELGMPTLTGADDLMACMAWESNNTFSPSIRNMAGSGATGLIQFMPATALAFFHSVDEIKAMSAAEKAAKGRQATDRLAALTAEDQLNYVYKYFRPFKGRLRNLGDVYMAILWPAGVGQPDSFVLWDKETRPTTYRQNAGLDVNKDGRITRAEAIQKVTERRVLGFSAGNYWRGA